MGFSVAFYFIRTCVKSFFDCRLSLQRKVALFAVPGEGFPRKHAAEDGGFERGPAL